MRCRGVVFRVVNSLWRLIFFFIKLFVKVLDVVFWCFCLSLKKFNFVLVSILLLCVLILFVSIFWDCRSSSRLTFRFAVFFLAWCVLFDLCFWCFVVCLRSVLMVWLDVLWCDFMLFLFFLIVWGGLAVVGEDFFVFAFAGSLSVWWCLINFSVLYCFMNVEKVCLNLFMVFIIFECLVWVIMMFLLLFLFSGWIWFKIWSVFVRRGRYRVLVEWYRLWSCFMIGVFLFVFFNLMFVMDEDVVVCLLVFCANC